MLQKQLTYQKPRQSNIELLRVVAMFFVLIIHANFLANGIPNKELLESSPIFATGQLFWQAVGICCVNIFVMISGWFGINFKWKGLFNLLFQILFIYNVVYLFGLITGNVEAGIGKYFYTIFKWNWFIPTYLLLYLLSPILNFIVERSSKKLFTIIVAILLILECILSWGLNILDIFNNGYNVVFFVVLYLLARYLKLYGGKLLTLPKYSYVIIALACIAIIIAHGYYQMRLGASESSMKHIFSFCNPFVILNAASLLVLFSRFSFNVKFINVLGASSLSVLIYHIHPILFQYYKRIVIGIGDHVNGLLYLCAIALFLSLVYMISVGIDQVRIRLWKRLCSSFPNNFQKKS